MKYVKNSPSSAERWLTCTASTDFINSLIDEGKIELKDSPYAREGTEAHEVAASTLREVAYHGFEKVQYASPSFPRSCKDYLPHAIEYMKYVAKTAKNLGFSSRSMHIEETIDDKNLGLKGTIDCFFFCNLTKEVIIFDYKYGKNVTVYAEDNLQLALYALLVIEKYAEPLYSGYYKCDRRPPRLSIVQPRKSHTETVEISYEYLEELRDRVIEVKNMKKEDKTFKYSGKGCRWCPAKKYCTEYQNRYINLLT